MPYSNTVAPPQPEDVQALEELARMPKMEDRVAVGCGCRRKDIDWNEK